MESGLGILVSNVGLDLSEFGIQSLSVEDFLAGEFPTPPAVAGVHFTPENSKQLMEKIKIWRTSGKTQIIGISKNLKGKQFSQLVSELSPFRWTSTERKEELIQFFQEGFGEYFSISQDRNLSLLLEQKNDELKRLGVRLENLVEQRQSELEESTNKYERAEKNLQLLQKTLTYIYGAKTLPEIEHGITQVLKKEKSIDKARIRLKHQSNWTFEKKDNQNIVIPIALGNKDLGELVLTHSGGAKNTGENKKFFRQIAEAVGLAIEKSVRKQQEQELGQQWEATFDAISYPISLTDSNFNLLQTNIAYRKLLQEQVNNESKSKCYELFFDRDRPCDDCRTRSKFKVTKEGVNKKIFEVTSAKLSSPSGLQYIHFYKDITQSLNLERQKIESAKMVELGTISSSIAHELNNPIGGMLNFIQLIQMDLDGNEPYLQDIRALEEGTRKCKSIVQNLLGFTRKEGGEDSDIVNLFDVIDQACKIVELKTRSSGISIEKYFPPDPIFISGRFNLLSQAVLCLLQNSQESLIERRHKNPGFKGEITLRITNRAPKVQLTIGDNGGGIDSETKEKIFTPLFTTKNPQKNSGLGLTLARQIFEEHNGYLLLKESSSNKTIFEIGLDQAEVES